MQLREEAADFAERLRKLNEHYTIAKYKDRNIDQEMADYQSKIDELTAAFNRKDEELERLEYKYMQKKGEIKAMDKFAFPCVLKIEEIHVKENDGVPKEFIEIAKEELINALQYYSNLKDCSRAITSSLRKEMGILTKQQVRWLCNIRPIKANTGLLYHCKWYAYLTFNRDSVQYFVDIA